MGWHVIIFIMSIGEKRERNTLTFWNPHSSRTRSNYFSHSIGNGARKAKCKCSKVSNTSTLDLRFVLSLQGSPLKSSTSHSSDCSSWRWRETNPWRKKKIRKSLVGASIFAALPTTDIVEGKNMCLIELRV